MATPGIHHTVLIVDQDLKFLYEIRERFENSNRTIFHASTVITALDIIEAYEVDVVLCRMLLRTPSGALQMSGGLSLINNLMFRKGRRPKIIALEAVDSSSGLLQHVNSLGVEIILQTPIDIEELICELERLLET